MFDLEKCDACGRERLPYPWKGVLDPREAENRIRIDRYRPSFPLRSFLNRIWILRWNGRPQEVQPLLPSPNAHLLFGKEQSLLFVGTRRFHSQTLEGAVYWGVRFCPGGLRPFQCLASRDFSQLGCGLRQMGDKGQTRPNAWSLESGARSTAR
jgi:hypothetical protein